MATTELVDRAESTANELSDAARRHVAEAEQAARRAAEAAQAAAELYAARASEAAQESAERLGGRAQQAAETIRHEASDLRTEVEELWDDPETRPWILGTAIGVTLVALVLWLWRRSRREEPYESTETEVAGWDEPQEVFDETPEEHDTEGAEA